MVVAILLIMFLVLPKMNAVSAANTELETAKAQEATLLSQLAALQQAQDDAEANRKIIENVEQQIPPTADEPGFLGCWRAPPPRPGSSCGGSRPHNLS